MSGYSARSFAMFAYAACGATARARNDACGVTVVSGDGVHVGHGP